LNASSKAYVFQSKVGLRKLAGVANFKRRRDLLIDRFRRNLMPRR